MHKYRTGDKTQALLQSHRRYFRDGLRYESVKAKAEANGLVTPMQLLVDRAEGDFVWDLDRRRYIDFQNGWATNPLGNCHPEIIDAVHSAQKRYGYHWEHPLRLELAARLTDVLPAGLSRVSFEVSGTEAAEAAVHLALCYKQARHIVSFTSSNHGEGLGTNMLSAYSSDNNLYMEAWAGGVIKAPYPYSTAIPAGMSEAQYVDYCLWYLEKHIPGYIASAENIAGILIEPGLAEGGNWIPTTAFMQGLRRICDDKGWLMIADEVLTGMGRTGHMWGVEHYGVEPDILVFGKNLSGGIEPCAGIAARDEILGDNPRASSGSTFAGTPAGCAAGLKTLEIYRRDGVVEQASALAERARSRMADWESKYGIVNQVRGLGLLIGVAFTGLEGAEGGNDAAISIARSVRHAALGRGLWAICESEPTVRLYPALTMDEAILVEGLDILEEAIAEVEATVESGGQLLGDYPAIPSGVVGF